MELNIYFFLAVLTLALILLSNRFEKKLLPATSNDWFVIFSIDGEKEMLLLWFYPVVGFRLEQNQVIPITSNPATTKSLSARQPEKIVKDKISVSYGRWLRDNALFDEFGNPDNNTFSSIVNDYLLEGYTLSFLTTVPSFYQKIISHLMAETDTQDQFL